VKPELLALAPIYAPTLAELERDYTVHKLWAARDPDAFIKEVAANVRGVVTAGLTGFTRKHIEALPRLEIIASFGGAPGTFDMAAAKERGVIVTNTPDSIADSVADLALGLMIAVMRRIG
jgi:lactate dehydrogenase-like 2-hydroxyacid dehydrogenase